MRKEFAIIIFLTFLIIPLASAINFDMKDTFHEEEVLIARLSGDFINPPLKENINFYRGHVVTGIDYSITKIGEDYYLFAPLSGRAPNNYSIVIEEVSYKKGSKTIEEDLVKNFTIIGGLVDFIIDKGFLNTKNNFYIELENLLDEDLEVTMNITPISGSDQGIINYEEESNYDFTLTPGSERIDFEIDVRDPTIKLIQFTSSNTSYEIPVSLYRDELAEASKIYSLRIDPSELDLTMNLSSQRNKLISIYNTGTGTLEDIKITLSDSLKPYVTISNTVFGQIIPGNNARLNMTILASATDGKVISGDLTIETSNGLSDSIEIRVESKEGYVASAEELATDLRTDDTCSSLPGGVVCTEEEECAGEKVSAKDAPCCIGTCNPKSKPSSFGKIIGWVLLIVIILAGVWFFFKKYKKVKTPVDLLKIAKGKK